MFPVGGLEDVAVGEVQPGEQDQVVAGLDAVHSPTGSTLQITQRDCRPRWTTSPLTLNAERRLPCSHGALRYGDIRVVATDCQI